jgi:hypothetical protein
MQDGPEKSHAAGKTLQVAGLLTVEFTLRRVIALCASSAAALLALAFMVYLPWLSIVDTTSIFYTAFRWQLLEDEDDTTSHYVVDTTMLHMSRIQVQTALSFGNVARRVSGFHAIIRMCWLTTFVKSAHATACSGTMACLA